jgi:hypothetical protein
LQLSEGEVTTETESSSGEETEGDVEEENQKTRKRLNRFKIPKMKKAKIWSGEQLENFRKNWPNQKILQTRF